MSRRQGRPVRVLVVDDLPVVRDGLRRMLEVEGQVQVVGETGSSGADLQASLALRPEVILLGVQMLKKSPVVCRIRAELRETPIIVLGLFRKQGLIQAMRVGAVGYVPKDASREEMLRAIEQVARGKARLQPSVTPRVITQFAAVAQERLGLGLPLTGQQRETSRPASQRATKRQMISRFSPGAGAVGGQAKHEEPDRNQADFRS